MQTAARLLALRLFVIGISLLAALPVAGQFDAGQFDGGQSASSQPDPSQPAPSRSTSDRLTAFTPVVMADGADVAEIDCRIELRWSSDVPRRWAGSLQVSPPDQADQPQTLPPESAARRRISDPVSLTPAPLHTAGVFSTAASTVVFGPPARFPMIPSGEGKLASVLTRGGGISFRVSGAASDKMILRIDGEDVVGGFTTEITLGELMSDRPVRFQVTPQATVDVKRIGAGDLRLRIGQGQTIFWGSEPAELQLHPAMLKVSTGGPAEMVLECSTYAAADGQLVSVESWPVSVVNGRAVLESANWNAPAIAGAYQLRWRLRPQAVARGWSPSSLNPTTVANSLSRSISGAMPSALSAPIAAPIGLLPVAPLGQNSTVQSSTGQAFPGQSMMHLPGFSVPGFAWPSQPTADGGLETSFGIAVVAIGDEASREIDGSAVVRSAIPIEETDKTPRWRGLGYAELVDGSSSVSRMLIQPTSQWIASASGAGKTPRGESFDGQRLTRVGIGQSREFAVPVDRPGSRHRVVIRVPRHLAMRFVVDVVDFVPETGISTPLQPALAIIRSGHADGESAWSEARIDFWPRSSSTRLVLSNRSADHDASVGPIAVSASENDAQAAMSRIAAKGMSGSNAPATVPPARLVAMRLEMSDWLNQFGVSGMPTADSPLDYHQSYVAANRLIETLVREGYGGVVLTVSSDGTALFPDAGIVPDAAWDANWASDGGAVDTLELLMRLFDSASLTLVPSVRPSSPMLELEKRLRINPSASSSILAPSPLGGRMGTWDFDSPAITSYGIYNPTHVDVLRQIGQSIVELNRRCGGHRCVPMIGVLADERSHLHLPSLASVDEQTLDEFHSAIGESAPPRAGLANWIQKAGAEPFERWRTARLASGFQDVTANIDGRTLLVLAVDSALSPSLVELGRNPRIITSRLHRRSLTEPLANRIRDEACNASVPVSLLAGQDPLIHNAGVFHQPLTPHGDFVPTGVIGQITASDGLATDHSVTPLLDSTESSLAMAQLLSRSDRSLIAIGGGGANQPAGAIRRASIDRFSKLPPVVMSDIESGDSAMPAVRVRQGYHRGETFVYAVNQTRFPILWSARFSRPASVIPISPTADDGTYSWSSDSSDVLPAPATRPAAAVAKNDFNGGEPPVSRRKVEAATRWQTTLRPGELVAIRIAGDDVKIVDWQASFAGGREQFLAIRAGIQGAVGGIETMSRRNGCGLITNPGFESEGDGGIPGWLTAQHPPGCVAIDREISFNGSRSLRLTGESGRPGGSWIVSQTLAQPISGRLAVSVRLRGEPARTDTENTTPDGDRPLVIRMAIEGTVAGTPIRKMRALTVPRNGQWTEPQTLEIQRLPSLPVESLRITIDLMSAGVVWVDDIACYDHFMTAAEKTQCEHLVFLAAGGASRGDCIGASRLLDSHWSLDLIHPGPNLPIQTADGSVVRPAAFVPSINPTKTKPPTGGPIPLTPPGPSAIPAAETRPGFGERLKSWIPQPLRFGS